LIVRFCRRFVAASDCVEFGEVDLTGFDLVVELADLGVQILIDGTHPDLGRVIHDQVDEHDRPEAAGHHIQERERKHDGLSSTHGPAPG
jgi:hypothetical protein